MTEPCERFGPRSSVIGYVAKGWVAIDARLSLKCGLSRHGRFAVMSVIRCGLDPYQSRQRAVGGDAGRRFGSAFLCESERIDALIAADRHAVAGAIVGKGDAPSVGHDRPALDVIGLAGDERVKRGMGIADTNVGTPVTELI